MNRIAEQMADEEITARFSNVEVVGDIERLPNNFNRGIKNIPVRLQRA